MNGKADNQVEDNTDKPASLIERAIQLHKSGELDAAKTIYKDILHIQPEHTTALHMLGVLEYQAGKYENAISLIGQAELHTPDDAGIQTNLGSALQACGRLKEAIARFRNAIRINPGYPLAYNNLGNALRLHGQLEQAVAAFQQALSIDKNYADAYANLAIVYMAMNKTEKAIDGFQKTIDLDPDHNSAAHMLAALRGELTKAAPPDHISHLFDEYASNFDHHLVTTLEYSMPTLLRDEIDHLMEKDAFFQKVVDLGCGTGLAGVAFRSISGHMTGIDLSSGMIEKASKRNVYDTLITGDIIATLQDMQENFDLFLCADVFPYIGNIEPLFTTLRDHANKNAIFAFSTESHSGCGYLLRPTGRYAHAQDYLRNTSADYGFSVITMRTENLRKQKQAWIEGDLVVLRYS